ncbi:MAG: peptide chain release factor 2, partial [Elusimicrobia bacterium]|nr:peptide chain release factor 2 [Elusimicrobiota bacterium]
LPTGAVVACQNERSQHQNKAMAMKLLKAKLAALEEDKRRDQTKRRYDGMGQIGWGHQIRSYVFMPYQMVKDLRTGHETGNISAVMDGEIDGFIEAYLTYGQNEK